MAVNLAVPQKFEVILISKEKEMFQKRNIFKKRMERVLVVLEFDQLKGLPAF